jgi:hypothetical protein
MVLTPSRFLMTVPWQPRCDGDRVPAHVVGVSCGTVRRVCRCPARTPQNYALQNKAGQDTYESSQEASKVWVPFSSATGSMAQGSPLSSPSNLVRSYITLNFGSVTNKHGTQSGLPKA